MKAVLWAGGLGTRLRPLTNNKQKCMIDINGKPCLERIIDYLNSFGITNIIVKVHFKYEQVMDYFGSKVLYYYQKELKDEEESLKEMSSYLMDDYTVVANGDTLTNLDLTKMIILAKGGNVKYMDNKDQQKYAGLMVLSPSYWLSSKKFLLHYSSDALWFDIGSFLGLNKARQYFYEKEKIINKLS